MGQMKGLALRVALALWLVVGLMPSSAVAGPDERAPVVAEFESAGTRFRIEARSGMERYAEQAGEVIRGGWPRIAEAIGTPAGEQVLVTIEHEMNDWFARNEVPVVVPEWAAGLALPSRRVVLLGPTKPDWRTTLEHELVHIAVGVASGDGAVPRWVQEGVAIAVAEPWGIERATTMMRAGVTGRFYAFSQLERGFPPAASSADLAYAQSFSLIRFIEQRHGEDVVRRLMASMREGRSFSEAFAAVTGESLESIFVQWEEDASGRYAWTPMLTGGGLAWAAAAALAFITIRRRRLRTAKRLRELELREQRVYNADPDDTTFG